MHMVYELGRFVQKSVETRGEEARRDREVKEKGEQRGVKKRRERWR